MTIGIYSLYWEEQDLIYIGQAQDIERRFIEHKSNLKTNRHSNYLVQRAYNKHGLPSFNILEICTLNQLNTLEKVWQNEFNSLTSLDLIEAGQVGYGTNSNSSKYLKVQILLVFRALYSTTLSYTDISKKYKVHFALVGDIKRGGSHLWLKEKYPKLYSKMRQRDTSINKNTISYKKEVKTLLSPDNKEYQLSSLIDFVRQHPEYIITSEHNLKKGIGRVLDGSRKSYHGWKIKTTLL